MHRLALAATIALVAGCADLLGVEALTGSDAGSSAGADAAGPRDDSGAGVSLEAGPLDGGGCAWVTASGGEVPAGAVPSEAVGDSGAGLYVCRVASGAEAVIPGKLLPGWACYYGDGQSEQTAVTYQVLVPGAGCAVAWASAPQGVTAGSPLPCGLDSEGGVLFSCRVDDPGGGFGALGYVGWSTNHTCVYSLSGQSLTGSVFDVLTVN